MRLIFLVLSIMLVGCTYNSAFYYPYKERARGIEETQHTYNYKELRLPSGAGSQLHIRIYQSPISESKGLVLHFHGNRGNLSVSRGKLGWLLDSGYDLVLFDYSGYGLSSGRPTPENTRHDALAMLEYVAAYQAPHSSYRKIVWGTSLGGAILADGYAVFSRQGEFDLIIIESAFHSYRRQAEHAMSGFLLGRLMTWSIPLFVSDDYAPIYKAERISGSKALFVHCIEDRVVPMEFGRRLFEKVQGPKYFWRAENCRHSRPFGEAFADRRKALLAFLHSPELVELMSRGGVCPQATLGESRLGSSRRR
ncbi:alpha/beta hydrolase [Marinobacterium arenosum]|uniref:alpha/beta hydrolase n=1 Tax=Marinobacterium arenosum TaxID=2862496 RepID=UPI001C94351B|nr:alpha/beta hydrolase [Marinobacterium arenosum]MBY4676104.1 alpha/beta hydrolase [Marinobacterium arenosum]